MFTLSENSGDDMLDVRDIIGRVVALRTLRQPGPVDTGYDGDEDMSQDELFAELTTLETFLSGLAGCGGDEKWEGVWYPVTLIRDSHFEAAMDKLLEDTGDLPKDIPAYLSIVVNYDMLQMDYTDCELEGVTYWYR